MLDEQNNGDLVVGTTEDRVWVVILLLGGVKTTMIHRRIASRACSSGNLAASTTIC